MTSPFTPELLETAFTSPIKSRQHFPADADIWHLRFHWNKQKHTLLQQLNAGRYVLSPLQVITPRHGKSHALWSSPDALVLRCLTILLQDILPTHPRCEHIAGHQGGKKSVQRVHQRLCRQPRQYVCRTDIKGYYAHIDKRILYQQVRHHVQHPVLLELVWQFLHYSVEDGGMFHTPKKGMARSSSLSPLLAAFHLYDVDVHFANQPHLYYARYMDDFIILARTRWQLRQAVRELNTFFAHYGFRQHPDKTFIGPTHKGVDWMGFWFTHEGCQSVAPRAVANHLTTLRRLYERTRHLPAPLQAERVAAYVRRWTQWGTTSVITIQPILYEGSDSSGIPCSRSLSKWRTEPGQ